MLLGNSTEKFIGMLASAGLTTFSTVAGSTTEKAMAVLPPWAMFMREWILFVGAPVGLIGMMFYASSMMLDNRRKWREERDYQRKELHEIHIAKIHEEKEATLSKCPTTVSVNINTPLEAVVAVTPTEESK